ncbi:MAG TPA: peptidogalycan biosysnthesis protein, partial [Myxococcota bacterium]|nr:peptidogalycan biosysnthesis protein [Myxococcota bacterium]
MSITVHAHTSVSAVDAAAWDGLVGRQSPFLRHAFLAALEASDCVGERSGWLPLHLTVHLAEDGVSRLVGLAPAFLKAHSMGEFVYDWAWADAAQRLGIAYYPKLVLA